jgi:hypothetical protein
VTHGQNSLRRRETSTLQPAAPIRMLLHSPVPRAYLAVALLDGPNRVGTGEQPRRDATLLQTAEKTCRVWLCSTPTSPGPTGDAVSQRRPRRAALDLEPALEGLDDDHVLALAATELRILVTHNVADVPRILREWAADQRAHAGVILVYGIDQSEFALIARGIERWLQLRPDHADWTDVLAILDRRFAGR